jgi:ATP-dependent DNA helicase RecG
MIRFQRLEGQRVDTGEKRNVVKDVPIEGRLPEMIEAAAKVIESQLREFSRLGNDGKFYRDSEYPREAWYEAIVNACVQRSYSLKGMNIFVKMFDDKFVVESPGSFPPLVTPENIYEIHHRRNYFLMDALFYLDYVKCENEGTKRMRDSMRRQQLPEPEFVQQEIGEALVRVTLRNNHRMRERWIDSDAVDIVGPELAKTLSVDENRLINFCAEYGKVKAREAERLTGKTWQTADGILKGLVEKGIMDRKSKYPHDPNGHHVLKNPPRKNHGS